jgi:uncharacterized protein
MPHRQPNRLIHEQSPYLLQHAHNPVDWHPWGEEAFAKARQENKPVLVSIGYAACHWCHVMERESFEDPEVAALMNERFVNIKVDREERPDVDHTYMDAVQAMTGSGGWPLNVFLTPEGKPFYGGTYFPPKRAFNRASWSEILQGISNAYREQTAEVVQQAESLTEHLKTSNAFGIGAGRKEELFLREKIDLACRNVMASADTQWGGFGQAPKFPQTFTITFLLRYAGLFHDPAARHQALLSLDKMIQGGLYDQLGGGFARYATDTEWLAPHFEKMLYDNALLVSTLSEAFQLTMSPVYLQAIEETVAFVTRELMHPDGGFYSALDADSEGEEGKFYVWDKTEVEALLGADAPLFCAYFDITEKGNWEGKNILRILEPLEPFAQQRGLNPEGLKTLLDDGRKKLMERRASRVRPGLDDKVLLGWNALMNKALSMAYAATGVEQYKNLALKNMQFLLAAFPSTGGGLHHTWKDGKAKYPAFLDDYAFLIDALITLSEVTGDVQWLNRAADLTQVVLTSFSDEQSLFFYYTNESQQDVLIRKREIYDGATPSGNGVMAGCLLRLGLYLNRPEWSGRAEEMAAAAGDMTIKYPTSFGVWLALLFQITQGTNEVAVLGPAWRETLIRILQLFIPHKVIMAVPSPDDRYPLLAGKQAVEKDFIYLCKNYSCRQPVETVASFAKLL